MKKKQPAAESELSLCVPSTKRQTRREGAVEDVELGRKLRKSLK